MKIRVQSIHFTADVKLLDFIQKKADKLDQFFDQIISGEVYLKLENTEDVANKITEIKLLIPGNDLFAKEQCKTFEEATDKAIESLKRQIDKRKTKVQSHMSNHKTALQADEIF
ncbi:MAG: ribosome hibernation-promoting factor, HPF/YfiA family [Daejeonella sp.]